MSDKKSTYIGLWVATDENNEVKLDKNGNMFLKGKNKETGIKYFVFGPKGDQRLCTAKDNEKMETIGTLIEHSNDNGEFQVCENHIVAENKFYEERPAGQPQLPEYQVKLPE